MKTMMTAPVRSVARRVPAPAGSGLARQGRAPARSALAAATLVVMVAMFAPVSGSAQSAVTVTTLAGGPLSASGSAAGDVDGPSLQVAQFNTPNGIAVDNGGTLYVADRDNGKIRRLDVSGDRTTTFVAGLQRPVDVATDSDGNVYVLLETAGVVWKYNAFANLLGVVASGLAQPTALALDSSTNIYVAELGGRIKRVAPNGTVTLLASGLKEPRGVEVADNGHVAVAESGNHAIRLINPATLEIALIAGGTGAGAVDGPVPFGKLNAPRHLAKAPNGAFVVADYGNHRYRIVTTNGIITTLYGMASTNWVSDYPGWEDGAAEFAEARDTAGVAVARDGKVFTSELYYHLIRSVEGAPLTPPGTTPGGGGGAGGTNIVVNAPTFTPNSGYYPAGQWITVSSPNPDVFYTTDGSTPTTNSFRVPIANNVGQIFWSESTRDLTSLRMRAFIGTNASVEVSGVAPAANEIGVARDVFAGPGATVVVPVVMNLVSNQTVRSLQFRVEISGTGPATPSVVSSQFRALSIVSNDFVDVVTPAQGSTPASFSATSYLNSTINPAARGLLVSFVGTNSGMLVKNYATAAMLAVPIPTDAAIGGRYRIQILAPSATSDGEQTDVRIAAMPARDIIVTNRTYVVGDSSPGGWYNAGDFGDGNLRNSDVNNAFYAALGIRAPFPFSDAFDAMDAFPEDRPGSVGGDGEIRFLDWQVILQRAARLSTNNWQRAWSADGTRVPSRASLPGAANSAAPRLSNLAAASGAVWVRQALVAAGVIGNAGVDTVVRVPVTVRVAPGSTLSGLLFSARVEPAGDSPALAEQAQFVPAPGIPNGNAALTALNVLGYGWDLGAFAPALEGTRLLGHIQFRVPKFARLGDCYVVRFMKADGSPDLATQYDLETARACVWVNTAAPAGVETISDEWKATFFGSADSPDAEATADADGDGSSNGAEYAAGTDPRNAGSRLELAASRGAAALVLRWVSAPGKIYSLESASSLSGSDWAPLGADVVGDGGVKEVQDATATSGTRFYRVRVR